MNYDWAVVGAKCICVDDEQGKYDIAGVVYDGDMDGLTIGRTYTLRWVGIDPIHDTLSVRLEEIYRRVEGNYNIKRFRPLVTRTEEQDIATFLEIARQAQTPVGADEVTT